VSTCPAARSEGRGDAIRRLGRAERADDARSSTHRRRRRAAGGTPLVVAENGRRSGVVHLKDVVKEGMRERFDELRAMGIRTVMITGDNPLHRAAIADEAGVDDFLAEATPEDKMALIRASRRAAPRRDDRRRHQRRARARAGRRRRGDEHRHPGGQGGRNMVDLDSNPTKLIEIVEIGKQLLITRGSLTTFSIANDVAKYFAIIPAMFAGRSRSSTTSTSCALDTPVVGDPGAVVFNALVIVALIRLAPCGASASAPRRPPTSSGRNPCSVYGLGRPCRALRLGIKLIDIVVSRVGIV
jgi:K+-transporting ATPase ATPase B chain